MNSIILVNNTRKNIAEFNNFIENNNIENKYYLNNNNFSLNSSSLFKVVKKSLNLVENNTTSNIYKKINYKKYNNYDKYFFDSKKRIKNMSGGGYIVDVSSIINGQPEYIGYDDFKRPLVNSQLLTNMDGGGFFLDLGKENVGGMSPIGGYDDQQPPLFVQSGGNLLNKKIKHLINYISRNGKYKLPKYVLNDINNL